MTVMAYPREATGIILETCSGEKRSRSQGSNSRPVVRTPANKPSELALGLKVKIIWLRITLEVIYFETNGV
jgi:hypothetical protein